MAEPEVLNAVLKVLNELVEGSAPDEAWVLNPEDPGLINSLHKVSAEDASAVPSGGGASIAAHVDHLRYGLELLNRWTRGEKPFADADYGASWRLGAVSEGEWASRLEALQREAYAWREALKHSQGFTDVELTGVVASAAHLAYHLGAVRQIVRATRGPSARD